MNPIKPQWIRIADVTVIGPWMMYAGGRKSNLPAFFRLGLFVFGALTITYNGYNWIQINRQSPQGIQETPTIAGSRSKGGCRWR